MQSDPPKNQKWKLGCSECSLTPLRIRSGSWAAVSAVQLCSDCSLTPPKSEVAVTEDCHTLSPVMNLQWLQFNSPPTHTKAGCGSIAFSSKVLQLFFSYIFDCLKQYPLTSTQPSILTGNNKMWQKVIQTSPYVIIRLLNLKYTPGDYHLSICEFFIFFAFCNI